MYKSSSFLRKCYYHFAKKHLSFEMAELFFQQNHVTGFLRYDIIVRLLAVECYYKINNYGFDLYYKMQLHRNGMTWADKSVGIFKDLIRSYENNGYQKKSAILLDANLHLLDGSHRMALALFHHQHSISAIVLPHTEDVFYSIEWFKINDFTDDECKILEYKFNSLKRTFCTPFICTIWHPARFFYEDITKNLSLFGNVREVKDFAFSQWDYRFFTRGIYSVDDIDKWKIEKKMDYMTNTDSDTYSLRIVVLEIHDPDFRLKSSTNRTISKKGEQIKKLIRRAYKDRIDNYFYDIIIHIGDNFYQNRHILRLLTMPQIDVKTILEHIKNNKYVITKIDVPYMPVDFPDHYPLGKDIDIICDGDEEYAQVVESVLNDIDIYKDYYDIRVVKKIAKESKEYRSLIRLEQEGHVLAFLFDISCRTGSLAGAFVKELILSRQCRNIYYTPSIKYEIVIRLDEYWHHRRKGHHLDYINVHKDSLDEHLCDRYLKFNWRKLL